MSPHPVRFNRKMLAVTGDADNPVAVDHHHHGGPRPMIEPVHRIRMPDNGRDNGPGIHRRPTKSLPFSMPVYAMEITDCDGRVISLMADGVEVHPDDIDTTIQAIEAFNEQQQ